jgi:hypothetical protein
VNNIGVVDPFRGLKILAQEYRLPSGRRIDILCEEVHKSGRGDLVVLEFKRDNSPDGVVAQILRYLEELSDVPLFAGRRLKGTILSGREDCVVSDLLKGCVKFKIESFCYSVAFKKVSETQLAEQT